MAALCQFAKGKRRERKKKSRGGEKKLKGGEIKTKGRRGEQAGEGIGGTNLSKSKGQGRHTKGQREMRETPLKKNFLRELKDWGGAKDLGRKDEKHLADRGGRTTTSPFLKKAEMSGFHCRSIGGFTC